MVGVEEGREFRFRGDLYSHESTFPLVLAVNSLNSDKIKVLKSAGSAAVSVNITDRLVYKSIYYGMVPVFVLLSTN